MNLRTILGSWAAPLLIHGHNQDTAMLRAAAAKAQGLDPAVYGVPLPGSNVTTTVHQTSGWLKGAILGAALLTGGATAGWLALNALKPSAVPTAPATSAPAPTQPADASAYDAVTEELQPDGTWKEIKRERLK